MNTPPIVSQQEWEAARQRLLVKEKAHTRARDAIAAERRRMPWMAVEKTYEFAGPTGKVSLLGLFEGRRQLIVYRAFFEPGVFGWPDHGCRGCSLGADQVSHLAHLHARDTTTQRARTLRARHRRRSSAASTRTSGWMNGTATTCSSATASACSAPTSSPRRRLARCRSPAAGRCRWRIYRRAD
jgi:predicted dithiol-disulfide oxidoreductase (DUF899 family)